MRTKSRIGAVARLMVVLPLAASIQVIATAPPAHAVETATLVHTIDTSQWGPSSPDPSGIDWIESRNTLLVVDGEVEEMSIFAGVNVWEASLGGQVTRTWRTTAWSNEPVGATSNPANDHVFVSDDNQRRVYDIDPGPDGLPGTADDTRTSFKTTDYGSSDPEGIAFGGGALFISDGVGKEIYRVDPRTNGFNGVAPAGDDLVSHFDTGTLGVTDPEGVEYNPTTGHLFIVSRGEKRITETTQSGALVAHLDISSSGIRKPAGVALAPGSTAPAQTHVYVADRASDNDSNPNENDGKIYEFALSGGAGNTAPVADAGPDRSIALTGSAQLSGSVADDGLPNGTLTAQWSTTSGPGTVTFAAPTSPATSATFSQAGTYVLRLTADDSAQTHWDEMTVLVTAGTGTSVQEIPVVGGSNDAEEKPTGGMRLTSTDLDIVDAGDSPGPQTVGLRFTGVGVPAGATIVDAYVQFQADEVSTGLASMVIQGQAADNPGTFTSAKFDVSSRPRTGASVNWVAAPWNVKNERGPAQRTPDLSNIIDEIVGRPGWQAGQALVVIFTGTGTRTAEAVEGARAPVLHIEYSL